MKIVTTLPELESATIQLGPKIVIVNLDSGRRELSKFQRLRTKHGFRAVGYYSHTDVDLASAAKAAGFDLVLSRGALLAKLESILASLDA